jgi:hypothetical protein
MQKMTKFIQPKSTEEAVKRMLEYLSKVQDLVDLHEFMQDEELGEAMDLALRVIAKPDIPVSVARNALVKMQGLSLKFRMQGATYTYLHTGKAGSVENIKKNVYFAISDQCNLMAQTLKYLAKEQFGA